MKTKFFTIGALVLAMSSSSFAQTNVKLNLDHKFNGADFVYGATYDLNGTAVSLSRVQYYLSGFELTHDGGQTMMLPDSYVLASANISSYDVGDVAVTSLEGIDFDLGVDAARNAEGISFWPPEHPLGTKSPSMDWGWPAGYFFFTITGMVDGNGDGTPNVLFEMHGLGDNLHRNVLGFSSLDLTGSTVTIPLEVNIADWLLNNDLTLMGSNHSGDPRNAQVADNTNEETVFTMNSAVLSAETLDKKESNIFADYTIAYAPTIYYNLATQNDVDITVYDLTGNVVLEDKGQSFEGNYFIHAELRSGMYMILFKNDDVEESFKFIVQQ